MHGVQCDAIIVCDLTRFVLQWTTAKTSLSKRVPEPPLLKDHKIPKRWIAIARTLEQLAMDQQAEDERWRAQFGNGLALYEAEAAAVAKIMPEIDILREKNPPGETIRVRQSMRWGETMSKEMFLATDTQRKRAVLSFWRLQILNGKLCQIEHRGADLAIAREACAAAITIARACSRRAISRAAWTRVMGEPLSDEMPTPEKLAVNQAEFLALCGHAAPKKWRELDQKIYDVFNWSFRPRRRLGTWRNKDTGAATKFTGNFPANISNPLRILPPLELEMHVLMQQFAEAGQVLQVIRHFAPNLVPVLSKLPPSDNIEERVASWQSLSTWELKRLNGPKLGAAQLDALVHELPYAAERMLWNLRAKLGKYSSWVATHVALGDEHAQLACTCSNDRALQATAAAVLRLGSASRMDRECEAIVGSLRKVLLGKRVSDVDNTVPEENRSRAGRLIYGTRVNTAEKLFDAMDRDGDGVLSSDELTTGLTRLGLIGVCNSALASRSRSTADMLAEYIDRDGNGVVSRAAFLLMI
eukprot:SAG31_NODE_5380_length_2575_cov_1.254039_3_plen_527_part_01